MDQLCIDQDNPREKQHEVPRMREYYGNSTVTLVAIHDRVGEEIIKKLLNSFAKGKSELIYPNEIVKNSLPFSEAHYEECRSMKDLCDDKIATPVGGRTIPLDGIYSIVGLLPYGDKIMVDYEKDPESVLREVMFIAAEHGYGEPLAWHGSGSKKLGLCWVPEVNNSNGSSNVKGSISIKYNGKTKKINFTPDKGKEEIVDGGLWRREVLIKGKDNEEEAKLVLSGTKEGIEAIGTGRDADIETKSKQEDNLRHRIDLLRIEEGHEKLQELKTEEKSFIIGLNNQETTEYQAQIESNQK
ncbi:5437_t:CDS:2 [Cetraspora pellucida]|uniref:5437_t:CDS:1 n=1 Tax=Cetraspora pellucida TaxID=1433469 RepID=A0ACA9KKL0_9GLOM|nr:5437_t:CDS:2 [Cetraspora pellucida]